jgi:hypothetical protein
VTRTRCPPPGARRLHRVTGFPVLDLFLRIFFLDAIFFLDTPHQLVALARDLVHFIVGKLSPLLFDLALELFPVPYDLA